ncbi:MAG: PEP/pyruvate-binding domain-containing protein, partial [Aquihabitans sp.]
MTLVSWFEEVSTGDNATVGGKGANLGEMARAGLPVPPGFVVTADAYLRSMDAGGVRGELLSVFAEAAGHAGDPAALTAAAAHLQKLVRSAGVADDVRDRLVEAYGKLGAGVAVAVRSSATAEDGAEASFAGMHESYVNVVGVDALLERLVDCWASLYGARVISYRASQGLDEEPAIAVV